MTEKLQLKLSLSEVDLGDLELFEDATGLDLLDEISPKVVRDKVTGMPVKDPDDPKGRPLVQANISTRCYNGMIFLALRKVRPDATYADARALKLGQFEFEFSMADDALPLAEAPETASEPES